MKEIISIDAEQVYSQLSPAECIGLMEQVFADEESGACVQYLRTAIPMPNGNVMAAMPAYFHAGFFGMKILSVYPRNSLDGYPSHQGQVLVFDEAHGELKGLVDAMAVTRVRTGCCSAVASRYLARPESSVLALVGCGHQAWSHLRALKEVFRLQRVKVFDAVWARAKAFAEDAEAETDLPVEACMSIEETVKDADIICTLTAAREPILKKEWVKPGAHINAVGACAKDAREIDGALTAAVRFYCDNVDSVCHESGDYLLALQEGSIAEGHIIGTIGKVMAGKVPGRTSPEEITMFESLGMAVEDLICADYLIGKAGRQ